MARLRFHLDENVNVRIADGMRLQGLDVTTTQEAGLLSTGDHIQFRYAQESGRVLVTQDADFLRIASKQFDHFGILFFNHRKCSLGDVILSGVTLNSRVPAENMMGRIEFVSPLRK